MCYFRKRDKFASFKNQDLKDCAKFKGILIEFRSFLGLNKYNLTSLDCTHKFRDFFFVGLALQRLSDITCLEHGLSVIEKKKPSERVKRTTYPDKKSFRDDIIEAIDWILKEGSAKEFDELLYKLEDAG